MSISVATIETSYSKLKIKNYLRNTMTQTQSDDLAMISVEKELDNSLGYVICFDQLKTLPYFQKLKPENLIVCCVKYIIKRQINY